MEGRFSSAVDLLQGPNLMANAVSVNREIRSCRTDEFLEIKKHLGLIPRLDADQEAVAQEEANAILDAFARLEDNAKNNNWAAALTSCNDLVDKLGIGISNVRAVTEWEIDQISDLARRFLR
jgi:hypothetical protein